VGFLAVVSSFRGHSHSHLSHKELSSRALKYFQPRSHAPHALEEGRLKDFFVTMGEESPKKFRQEDNVYENAESIILGMFARTERRRDSKILLIEHHYDEYAKAIAQGIDNWKENHPSTLSSLQDSLFSSLREATSSLGKSLKDAADRSTDLKDSIERKGLLATLYKDNYDSFWPEICTEKEPGSGCESYHIPKHLPGFTAFIHAYRILRVVGDVFDTIQTVLIKTLKYPTDQITEDFWIRFMPLVIQSMDDSMRNGHTMARCMDILYEFAGKDGDTFARHFANSKRFVMYTGGDSWENMDEMLRQRLGISGRDQDDQIPDSRKQDFIALKFVCEAVPKAAVLCGRVKQAPKAVRYCRTCF